jgi:hypothetical protein
VTRRALAGFGILAALCVPFAAAAQPAPGVTIARRAPPASHPNAIVVEQDTLIRLMVLNEVSTRTAKPGDRFVLRVDEPVVVDGVTIVPVGAKAWGEVLSAESSGAVGKAGSLSARLLHLDLGGERIPISGENQSAGERGSTQLALGVLALGPLALLSRVNNAKLKAGEIFSAYFADDMLFDPTTAKLVPFPK